MRSNPSLSWQKLQDVYYSINPCYEGVKWPIDNLYSNLRVSLSTPLTLLATASKFVPYPNVIDIYSISGHKIWSLIYNSTLQDHIVDFCFFHEDLCVVLSNQKFRYYTDFEGTFNEYSYTEDLIKLINSNEDSGLNGLGPSVGSAMITNLENNEQEEPFHVLNSYVWGDFLVLRNKDKLIFTNLLDYKNYEVQLEGLEYAKQNELCLLSCTESTATFLISYDVTIYKIHVNFAENTFEMVDEQLTDGPFSILSASPNGSLIALLNDKLAKIFVITKSFDRILLEYDTSNESSLPYMIEWAGNDAIVLSLRDEIKLIGPGQKSVSFFYDIIEHEEFSLDSILTDTSENDLSFVIPLIKSEKDGLKIISKNKVEFLTRVPDCSVKLHLMGSSHPSLILLDCVEKLALQASKADSNISLLKSEKLLGTAINSCLEAALEEFLPLWQQKILKAVSFGKIYFSGEFNADEYLRVLYTIKALNQIRSPELGLFLTYSEIMDAGWPAVIKMLLLRSQHLLALKIVDLLQLEDCRSNVYIDWCQRKIRKELNMSDESLFVVIAKKLLVHSKGEKPNVIFCSISKIFEVSLQEGRLDLCKLLVNLEPSGSLRMKQLLRINESELALIKSFQSCDYDLCKLLFYHFKDTLPALRILQIISQNEIKSARDANASESPFEDEFLKPILRENVFVSGDLVGTFFHHAIAANDPELLDTYLKFEGKGTEQDLISLQSLREGVPIFEEGEEKYENINQWYKNKLRPLKSSKKLRKFIDVESSLLDLQYRLSNTFQQSFYEEKSVVGILKKLIKMNQLKQAAKISKEFGLSQAKLWFLVLETYSKSHDFDRLHKFITASNPNGGVTWKSPIGFLPIVESSMTYEAPRELISIYISHCSDLNYTKRVSLYIKNEDFKSAIKEAYSYKDHILLKQISEKLGPENEALALEIKTCIQELGY